METIRATVVGAGSYITNISGSTIEYDEDLLPLKNIPVLKITPDEEKNTDLISECIKNKLKWFETADSIQPAVAIAITGEPNPGFTYIQELATQIVLGAKQTIDAHKPLIVIIEKDMAKVMGQTFRTISKNSKLICIDGIKAENGDYIDIGRPVAGSIVLPVVVKTLVFK